MKPDHENFGVWMNTRLREVGLSKFKGVDMGSGRLPHPIALNAKEALAFFRLLQEWDAIESKTVKVPLDSRTVMVPSARFA